MTEATLPSPLLGLAKIAGVATFYEDVWGKAHEVDPENVKSVLAAMGFDTSSEEALAREVEELLDRKARSVLPTVVLLDSEGDMALLLDKPLEVKPEVRLDSVKASLGPFVHGEPALTLTERVPTGVHRGTLLADTLPSTIKDSFTLISSPKKGYRPPALERGERLWGINVPLYGVRSERNWGIGDFTDLLGAVKFAAGAGADSLGLLPLHALPNEFPAGVSPYYPWSRIRLNAIYIDVEAVEEAATPEGAELLSSPSLRAQIETLRETELVDYEGVWNLKLSALKGLFKLFLQSSPKRGDFDLWRDGEGEDLQGFAVFCTLRGHLAKINGKPSHWKEWPKEFSTFHSPAVKEFARANEVEVTFHAWLQWLAETQFRKAEELAKTLSMEMGLYLDLALGVDPGGPEAWVFQDILALDASAGCPPDPFSLLGQEWGLPPINPERHRRTFYAYGEKTYRANMRFAGGLRIDHAAGLGRLFWVPRGKSPKDGAYVTYPLDEQLSLLRAASCEGKCLVIGEDLGTVPQEVRDGLQSSGFFSYKLLMFERDWGGTFKAPFNFPENSLISFGTHDLPTMDGWWTGRDLTVKTDLSRYPDEETRLEEAKARREDRKKLADALIWQKLLPEDFIPDPEGNFPRETLDEMAIGLHTYLARTKSGFLLANIDDLLGTVEMQNLPGTLQQHPNWRQKLPVTLENWPSLLRASSIIHALVTERGRSPRSINP